MSTSVVFNGVTYNVPSNGETGWGTEVSNLLIAFAQNAQTTTVQKYASRVATAATVTVSATSDCFVGINRAGAVTVNLPAIVDGQIFFIKDVSGAAATNNITIVPNGVSTIDGAANHVLNQDNAGIAIVGNGSNWNICSEAIGSKLLRSRIATGTASHVIINDGSGNLSSEAQLAATRGGTGVSSTATFPTSGVVVTRDATETLTNKTLTSPVISTISNTGTLTLPTSTDTLVGRATTDTLTNKTLTSPVISTIMNTGTLTLPTSTDTLVGRATTDTLTNKSIGDNLIIRSASEVRFNNSGNTQYIGLKAGTLSASTTFTLPTADGTSGNVLSTNGSGVLSFISAATTAANVAANDSNVTFTNSDNRTQICNPTAARTYTLPTTSISAGDTWTFVNRSNFNITLNSSGGNLVTYITPLSIVTVAAVASTPTAAADWTRTEADGDWYSFTPTGGWSTNTTYTGLIRRDRDRLHFRVFTSLSGAPNSANFSVNIPSPFTVTTSKILNSSTDGTDTIGFGTLKQSTANGSNIMDVNVWYNGTAVFCGAIPFASGSNHFFATVTDTTPVSFASGGKVMIEYSLPMDNL